MKLNGRLAGAIVLTCIAGAAAAQQVYRNVDANGKVTYSDQPPSARSAQPAQQPRSGAVNSLPGDSALPYELRQVVQRYPVTLYTSENCQPCDAGRSLLTTRGVPFTERTVQSPQDSEALQRITGQNSLPILTIGAQQMRGFQDADWSQYLDVAGYPPSTRLPPSYRQPPAAPLVAQVPVAPAAAAPQAAPAASATPPPASGPTPDNPAGIKF